MRLVGAGNPPWHRFRVGLEFVFSGRREFDGMIAQHAKLARTFADQLELPAPVSSYPNSNSTARWRPLRTSWT